MMESPNQPGNRPSQTPLEELLNNKITMLALGLLLLAGLLVYFYVIRHQTKSAPPVPNPVPPPAPTPSYSSFGPGDTFSANCWSAGAHAHADWFIAPVTGSLSNIAVAIEPSYVRQGREQTAGALDLFLARDEHGFPGAVLEHFSLAAEAPHAPPPVLPQVVGSVVQPALEAGVKYWLGARGSSPGEWIWHFGDHQIAQKAAREQAPGKWVSAGDTCYVGAFRIRLTPNQLSPTQSH